MIRMKLFRPVLAALLFIVFTLYFTYYFGPTLVMLHMNPSSRLSFFISSPFNVSTDGSLLLNLYIPAVVIFALGFYLKNFNTAFQKKCNLRSIFLMSIVASYAKSVFSMVHYNGYADFGISLGTSVITLSFMVAFLISLEVYIDDKEKYEHLYSRFMFAIIASLLAIFAFLITMSFFFNTTSTLVHAVGLTAFLIMFIPFYERANIAKFAKREEHEIERALHAAGQPE